jgi:hypothetical protein
MPRKNRDPEAPEVLEAVLARIRAMTREEWLKELAWRPEGATETWRTQRRTYSPGEGGGEPPETLRPPSKAPEDTPEPAPRNKVVRR